MTICVFCFKHKLDTSPWCKDNPGDGCTYGLRHEYPLSEEPKKQVKKTDTKLCVKCGLHEKNPKYATSECKHQHTGFSRDEALTFSILKG